MVIFSFIRFILLELHTVRFVELLHLSCVIVLLEFSRNELLFTLLIYVAIGTGNAQYR